MVRIFFKIKEGKISKNLDSSAFIEAVKHAEVERKEKERKKRKERRGLSHVLAIDAS